jgi:hypothetical protein
MFTLAGVDDHKIPGITALSITERSSRRPTIVDTRCDTGVRNRTEQSGRTGLSVVDHRRLINAGGAAEGISKKPNVATVAINGKITGFI